MSTLLRDVRLPEVGDQPGTQAGRRADLVLDEGLIAAITDAGSGPTAPERVVEGHGLVVVPGLVDTHIHLLGPAELTAMTDAGITTAVDLGTHPDSLVEELRRVPGVTSIVSAGSTASAPGAHQTTVMGFPPESAVTGPDDAARFVAWRKDAGSDLIKVIVEDPDVPGAAAHSPETLRALADAAREQGMLTVAHTVTAYAFTMGLDAGLDVLTHSPMDRPLDDEVVARMVEQGTACSPTLVMMQAVARAFAGRPGPRLDLANAVESVRRMHVAGVPVVAGTDANAHPGAPAAVPHGASLHDELDLLAQAGMTPAAALAAATSRAAEVMRLPGRGRLEVGARADLVLLEQDPSTTAGATRDPRQVWVAGEQVR